MRSKKAEKLSESPNIESATGEPIVFDFTPEEPDDTSKSAVDGIPIDEKDIEFHAKDIKKKDDSKLFVKVEGAERLARQKERAAKKKDDELIKRLQTAANKRKKEYKDAEYGVLFLKSTTANTDPINGTMVSIDWVDPSPSETPKINKTINVLYAREAA